MDKVQKSLNDLQRRVEKSNKIVAKGDKLGYGDAIKLGRKSNSIVSTIKKAIKEYDGTEPTEAESKKILNQMKTIVDLTEKQLDGLVANKSHFEKLKVGGLVKKNMGKTSAVSEELSKVMLEKAPASLKPEAEELNTRRAAGFKKATAAFANSEGGEDKADEEDDSD
ncbi:hypothetical protein EJ08DRAFT_638671 [Tothia fuscella]|uniref:Uncharacterized protein n=1 Tax=Tothia fuscella TaxID=1048955 RepID=A0A9P4NKY7_9PEZI|nr:hypothetical protein EJ08DRAFT_638671 [Tothia fuscella]